MIGADDDAAIRAVVAAQFAALRWFDANEADCPAFEAGFLADALLVPTARPARAQPVATFVARMRRLRTDGTLRTFAERPLAIRIEQQGTVAVVLAGCEITENGDTVTRDVSAFLLVRSDGAWQIAAQAWDAERPDTPFPSDLLAPSHALSKDI